MCNDSADYILGEHQANRAHTSASAETLLIIRRVFGNSP